MMEYDLVIIGAGPAGYVAAVRAGQMGLKTVLLEKSHLGGMCLNWGCVAVRSMMESGRFFSKIKKAFHYGIDGVDPTALKFNWKNALERTRRIILRLSRGIAMLLEKNGVEVFRGIASIQSPNLVVTDGGRRFGAKNILIATGSRPEMISTPEPIEKIVEIDRLFQLDSIPGTLAIYGESPTALELARLFSLMGCSVTLITPGPEIISNMDPRLTDFAKKLLQSADVRIITGGTIDGNSPEGIKSGGEVIPCGILINSSRRKAVLPHIVPDIETDDGFIKTDEYFQTGIPGIYAAGDVNGRSILAHSASAQAVAAVNHMAGIREVLDFDRIPLNIYTSPEISQVGLTEPQLKSMGIDFRITELSFASNAKAYIEEDSEGFIRILSERKYGQVLGAQIVSIHATDLIAEAQAIMQMEGTVFDMARILHAHPTTSEIFTEAAEIARQNEG